MPADQTHPLQKEYCPPIDSSLFSAIALDYNLLSTDSYNELRATLDILKESALAEESATFDPSGSGGLQREDSSSHSSSDLARSWHGETASATGNTEDTDLTGIYQTLGDIDLENGAGRTKTKASNHEVYLEALPPAQKIVLLKEMFPEAKDFDINYTLKKAGNDFGKAVEELLNQVFLAEEASTGGGQVLKRGIDGFSEPSIGARGRRMKGRKKKLLRRTSSTSGIPADKTCESPSPLSRWDRAKEDIDFIAQRTYIPPPIIASTYHKNGASLPVTIAALCTSKDPDSPWNPLISTTPSSVLDAHTAEIGLDFPSLVYSQHSALIRLTHPSTASAHELARAIVSGSSLSSSSKIIPQYLPRPPSPPSPASYTISSTTYLPLPAPTAAALAATRSKAFTQAQSAYRKSKSNHLMGGAASYYSSIGRDSSAYLRQHEATAADALVASQSRAGEIDLHGANVRDAVRIAKERVDGWWEDGGRERARAGKVMGGGLRFVTGQGRHSEGGKGKLGPAVASMLLRNGWKVEIGQGTIDVVGRARR